MISLKHLFLEGRYDSLVTTLSNKLLGIIKDSYSAVSNSNGKFGDTKIFYKQDETVPEIEDDKQQPAVYFEEVENATINQMCRCESSIEINCSTCSME